MKGSDHRVFFQNAEGNINMGVLFNDPDVELDDIFWYNMLAIEMEDSMIEKEGLVSVDSINVHNTGEVSGNELSTGKELKTYSCYVELHRTGFDRPRITFIR